MLNILPSDYVLLSNVDIAALAAKSGRAVNYIKQWGLELDYGDVPHLAHLHPAGQNGRWAVARVSALGVWLLPDNHPLWATLTLPTEAEWQAWAAAL
jgi:hypothetical protein